MSGSKKLLLREAGLLVTPLGNSGNCQRLTGCSSHNEAAACRTAQSQRLGSCYELVPCPRLPLARATAAARHAGLGVIITAGHPEPLKRLPQTSCYRALSPWRLTAAVHPHSLSAREAW